jgi:hypothetical protein
MIPLSTIAKTTIEQNNSVTYGSSLIFEHNMNSMMDGITVSGATITMTDGSSGATYTPFKKLFPVDSIIKPFRPVGAGLKYAISGDVDAGYKKPESVVYTPNFRIYYPGSDNFYKYYVSGKGVGLNVTVNYPKTILTNKIVARFELSHSTPATWTILGNGVELASGTSSDIVPFTTTVGAVTTKNYNAGTVVIYYNGTSWGTVEPTTIAAPVSLISIGITSAAVAEKYVGLIELSPKWYLDATENLVNFRISKESSTSSEELMPVGKISANSVILQLISYEANRKMISYDKTMEFSADKIYLFKSTEIRPYVHLYNSGGSLSDSKGSYDKILQGVFYADTWSISEFGDITVNALDGAKHLQETVATKLLCENFSATAIIRRLLDSVGFTNYNFNIKDADKSIITPTYWWTENNKTVWDCLQELCRDTQMTAVFSYNNVLEFYSREWIFDATRYDAAKSWNFRSEANGSNLPNILSFNKNDLPSANQVKVFWNSVLKSNYIQSAQVPWMSETYFLAAFTLDQNIYTTNVAGEYMHLTPSTVNEYELGTVAYNYTGYLAIGSEIIEYDAVQFQYDDENGTRHFVDLESKTDNNKWLGVSKQGTFRPTNKYRIKSRGAFGTKVQNHLIDAQSLVNSWGGYEVVWK